MVQYLYFRVPKSQFKSGSRSLGLSTKVCLNVCKFEIKRKSIGVERSGLSETHALHVCSVQDLTVGSMSSSGVLKCTTK